MTIPPSSATLQLIEYVLTSLSSGFTCELVPQIFHQLQSLKFAKMLDGLECGLHSQSLAAMKICG